MLPDEKVKCPATGFTRSCRQIVADCSCPKFITLKGVDAEGKTIDLYGCSDGFLPKLLIENAQASRQTGAAIESFRNEVVEANERAERAKQEFLNFARSGGPRLVDAK